MAQRFKSGDVVSLKSGGPNMTIVDLGTYGGKEKYKCRWFDHKNALTEATFTEAELEIYVSPLAGGHATVADDFEP